MDFFSVKQNYYTGNYKQTLQEVERLGNSEDETAEYYKLKAELALKKYNKNSSTTKFGKIFDHYVEFLKNKDISSLEKEIDLGNSSTFEVHLLASAYAILGRLDESLDACVRGIDGNSETGISELVLLAIQVALLNSKHSIAQTMFENYVETHQDSMKSEDELIINLSESYIKFASNQDTTSSAFYYYEELAQTFPTWKTQLGLLNLHLQQGNVNEAQGIVDLLNSDYYSVEQKEAGDLFKPHFLASKITLGIMQGSEDVDDLKKELENIAPDHVFVKKDKEINAAFDEIVGKYSV